MDNRPSRLIAWSLAGALLVLILPVMASQPLSARTPPEVKHPTNPANEYPGGPYVVYLPLALSRFAGRSAPGTTPTPTATPTPSLTPTPLPPDGVVVTSSSFVTETLGTTRRITVVGEVENRTTAYVGPVHVYADLYNSQGHTIGAADGEALIPVLAPDRRSPFKVQTALPPTFASYDTRLDFAASSSAPLPELSVADTSLHRVEEDGEILLFYLFGQVTNDLEGSIENLRVIATTYDADGRVIHVATTDEVGGGAYLSALGPGQASPFRLLLPALDFDRVNLAAVYQPAPEPPEIGLPVIGVSDFVEEESRSLFTFGEVQNTTGWNVQAVKVVGTLYDGSGTVINAASAYVLHGFQAVLEPGATAPFQLDFSAGPADYAERRLVVSFQTTTLEPANGWAIPSVTAYREQRDEGDIVLEWVDIYGEVRNDSTEAIESVRVIGTFYDSQGVVVNTTSARTFRRWLEPGGKSPFQVSLMFGPLDYATAAWSVDYETRTEHTPSALRVISTHHSDAGGQLVIQGDVENDGVQAVAVVEVYVTLYDEAERVINAARVVLDDVLEPQATAPFEVRFSQHIQGWATYDVQVGQ